jgi:glycine oxidase
VADRKDIIVVGAGIIGCAVACELARRGAAVQIVDDRPAGMGATQASAGVLAPYIEAHAGSPLLDLTVRSLALFDEFIARTTRAAAMPVGYARTGTLDVAFQDETMRRLHTLADLLRARAVSAELLDARAVRDAEPELSREVVGGLMIPVHGFVAAAELTRVLAAAACRHGARVVDQGRVRRIRSSPHGGLSVDTDGGSLNAGGAVLAAGSWAGQVEIDGLTRRVPVRPVRGQLLHLGWVGPALRRVTWGERCYLVPREAGTLLVGATVEEAGFDERTTAAGVRDLLDAACELVPRGWTASLLAARVGLRPGTPDELPVIGPSVSVPGLMYATGHYRNGVLLAPLTAQLVADAMLNDHFDPALSLTTPQRFGEL